jgi:hypothetical protein
MAEIGVLGDCSAAAIFRIAGMPAGYDDFQFLGGKQRHESRRAREKIPARENTHLPILRCRVLESAGHL